MLEIIFIRCYNNIKGSDNYLTDSTERPSDLHVLVFNNANGEMVDKARFIMAESMTRKEIKMQAD